MTKTIKILAGILTLFAAIFLPITKADLSLVNHALAASKPAEPSVVKGKAPINGADIYYEIKGEGFPVILIHGTTLDTRMWDDQFTKFAKKYKVIRYDMRGHGKSSDPVVGVPYSHVGDLNVLMEYLKIDKAALVGLSSGGKVAIAFTLTHPEKVAALVAADPVLDGFSYFGNGGFLTRFIKVFGEGRKGNLKGALDLWVADPLFAPALRNPDVAQKLKKIVYDHRGFRFLKKDPIFWPKPPSIRRLSDIDKPALVILGELDIPDINAIAQIVATQVKDAKLEIIKDSGHMTNMEKPDKFNQLVLDFMDSQITKKN